MHFSTEGIAAEITRARDLGIPFKGLTGPFNAITDVPGVMVGHATIIEGDGPLIKGKGPIRTGVTAILPRGRHFDPVYAATYALNGNGEMTGIHWIEESGFLETPIMISNTFSVGVVRDAVISWMDLNRFNADPDGGGWVAYPVVAETYDGLNDILGQHVTKEHAFEALDSATSGFVPEGNVGGGTGMVSFGFKSGIGTSSRLMSDGYTLGVLVQANFGSRKRFTVAGVPVGEEMENLLPGENKIRGSIIVVVATDAPLIPVQLRRVAERVPLALGRLGGLGESGSGDIFIAFSTGNPKAHEHGDINQIQVVSGNTMDRIFHYTVETTEEAILNAMVTAKTMTGKDGKTAHALPHDRLVEILKKYQRWVTPEERLVYFDLPLDKMKQLAGKYKGVSRFEESEIVIEENRLFLKFNDRKRLLVPTSVNSLKLFVPADYQIKFSSETNNVIELYLNGELEQKLTRVN